VEKRDCGKAMKVARELHACNEREDSKTRPGEENSGGKSRVKERRSRDSRKRRLKTQIRQQTNRGGRKVASQYVEYVQHQPL
jgi:hypothetical protein